MGLRDLNFELRPSYIQNNCFIYSVILPTSYFFFLNFDIGSVCMRMDTVLLLFITFLLLGMSCLFTMKYGHIYSPSFLLQLPLYPPTHPLSRFMFILFYLFMFYNSLDLSSATNMSMEGEHSMEHGKSTSGHPVKERFSLH